jgi:type I restriction enzyme S subunit
MRETLVKTEEFKDSPLERIPIDWDTVSIDEIAVHVGSGVTPRGGSNVYQKEGILFIRSQNVTFNGLRLDDVAYIDNRTHESMKRSEVFAHDVLLNITGASIGRCCPVPAGLGAANVNQHVCAIRLSNPNREDAIFLSSVLASYIGQSQIDRLNAGGNREGLNYEQLRAFVIPFPPPNERAGIAKIVETVDEAIAHTSSLIAKLKLMKAGLLHDLLTRGLDENGELRDAIGHPELFKDSPLGRIPEDWDTSILDKIISIIDCKHYTPKYVSDGIPIVRPRNIKVDGLDFSDIDYVLEKEYKLLTDKHIPRQGDIVFSRNASFGIPCYVGATQRFAIGQDVVIMTELIANTRFVYYTLIADSTEKQIQNVSAGSTFGRINLACIRELVVPVPPREEQERIAQILDTYDTRIRAEEAYRDKLKLQKQGLMHDLLTGKVRVKNA